MFRRLGGSGLTSSSTVFIANSLLSSGASLYSPLNWQILKYASRASVMLL